MPKIHKIIPVEVRKQNYIKKRNDIFNAEHECNELYNSQTRHINKIINETLKEKTSELKTSNDRSSNIFDFASSKFELDLSKQKGVRQRFKLRNEVRKRIASTTLDSVNDTRKFVSIKINGFPLDGLLDSGASITCLGKGGLQFLTENGINFTKYPSKVKTANNSTSEIVGRFIADVEFRGVRRTFTIFVAPSLTQTLYLGCDFWDTYSIWHPSIYELSLPIRQQNSHELSPEETLELNTIISLFPSFDMRGLGKTDVLEHTIYTGDSEPVKQRHYPYSPNVQKLVFEEVNRMLQLGVIERCNSAWNSPVCLVRKPGKNRLCLDSRAVNAVTKKDAYPLPHIEGLLSRLEDTHYISSVDLKDAFWQIGLEKDSKEKTAFTIPNLGHFQFTRMPFGLCNAAQTMSRLMDSIFPTTLRENVFVYLDDLLIVSKTLKEHFKLLREVAARLRMSNLSINVSKSHFCSKELKYLGYIVGGGQLKTDPEKVAAIVNFSLPKSQKQVRRFLGMTGWYRRFIPNYSQLAAPFTDSLKKSKKFFLSPEAVESFNKLKSHLTSAPILSNPDFTLPFVVQCDASTSGVGGVLYQIDKHGNERVIYYHSKKLNSAQKNYSITELECLAALECVKKFRPFIELHDFKIVTDHASLKWLMGQKDLSGRLARWSLKLQCFKFEIEHRKGTENVVPDALSRSFSVDSIVMNSPATECCFADFSLHDKAFTSIEYMELIKTSEENRDKLPDIFCSGGYVFRKIMTSTDSLISKTNPWKLWIPHEMSETLIKQAHEPTQASHGGISKTLKRLQELFYWPNMYLQVKSFVNSCEICKKTKAPNYITRPPMGKQIVMERPFQQLYIDLLGPYPRSRLGYTTLLICLDNLTKFIFAHPLKKATSKNIIEYLVPNIFCTFGTPEFVYSDNGRQFISESFEAMLKARGIKHLKTPKYCPQSNASERVNRSILSAIRSYITTDQTDWDKNIPQISSALRSSVHEAIKMSPFQALFGLNMVQHGSHYDLLRKLDSINENCEIGNAEVTNRMKTIHENLKENLRKSYLRYEKNYNLRTKPVTFSPGQVVFRRNFILSDKNKKISSKLCHKFTKCRIKESIGGNRCLLEDMDGKTIGVYHNQHLRL